MDRIRTEAITRIVQDGRDEEPGLVNAVMKATTPGQVQAVLIRVPRSAIPLKKADETTNHETGSSEASDEAGIKTLMREPLMDRTRSGLKP